MSGPFEDSVSGKVGGSVVGLAVAAESCLFSCKSVGRDLFPALVATWYNCILDLFLQNSSTTVTVTTTIATMARATKTTARIISSPIVDVAVKRSASKDH